MTTVQQGGKGITVTKVRQGSSTSHVDAVWIVTVKGGGSFTLAAGGAPSGPLTPGSDITSAVEGLHSGWTGHVHVSISTQPEGVVYTITWDDSVAPVSTLAGDGGNLTAQNEIDSLQVLNATGGTFNLTFKSGTLSENYNVTASDLNGTTSGVGLNDPAFAAIHTVPDSSTAGTVHVILSGGAIHIEFKDGWAGMDVSDMSTDSTNLVGVLDTASHTGNGTLAQDAHFDASITDGAAILTELLVDGAASVTTTTLFDGGTGLGVNTTTGGGASVHEVQTLSVRASAGQFTLTSGTHTTAIIDASQTATALASDVQSKLGAQGITVTVTGAQTVGGKLLTITFTSTGDQPQLQPTITTPFTGVNEVQSVTVNGAVGGTYTLTYNGTTSGTITFNNGDGSLETQIGSLVSGTVHSSHTGSTWTITFDGTGVVGTNVKPLGVGPNLGSTLTAQNEVQHVKLLNATGGTFTLTTSNGTTSSTTSAISYNAALDHTAQPTLPAANNASGGTLAAGTYFYVVTALTSAGEGVASAEVSASTDPSHGTIHLSWTMPGSPSSAVTGYRVYRGTSTLNESVYFDTGSTGTTFDDTGGATTGAATPPTTDLTTALSNLPALGAAAGEVAVTGSVGDWTIRFSGTDTHAKHFDKFVGDAGGLLNSNTLSPLSVTLNHSSTGTDLNHDGVIGQDDLVVALQTALNAAAVAAGITPGFLSAAVTSGLFTGGQYFAHDATDDAAFEVDVPLAAQTNSTHAGTITVVGTSGNFTITVGPRTTSGLAIGSSAAVVQTAVTALPGFTDTVTVTLSGSTYTFTFGSTNFSSVSGDVILQGSIPLASEGTIGAFQSALQTKIQSLIQGAGISGGSGVSVGTSGNALTLTSSSLNFGLMFQEPIVASVGGGRISLTAPQVLHTADASKASIAISRSVNVDVQSFTDPSLQVLGLATSPTRLTYTAAPSTEIDFTLFVNDKPIPIVITTSDLASVHSIDALTTVLQQHIDSALSDAFLGGELSAAAQIQVCRPNINPAAGPCDDVGNRVTFRAVSGVSTLAIDVPATLADGTTPNGTVTELGFQAVSGATSHSRAGRFFLDNVHLTGTVEVVLQDVSVTASLGFLALTGTVTGTLPEGRLLSLTADIRLRNPLVSDSDGCGCQNTLDIGVLINAIRAGHVLYNSDDVHGGSADTPPTGFFKGTLSGGFGADLKIVPAGVLSGLADTVSADLMLTATSDDWFSHFPTPDVHFAGPDFQSIISKFQSLDFGSITQALLLIVNFVKGLNQPGTAIGDVMSAKLPLINQSLGDLLNIASDIATKIQAIVTNPAGAIQQLNNILANALGLPTPSATVTDNGLNGSSQDVQTLSLNADAGTFAISFTPSGGGAPQTTLPIKLGAAAADVRNALNKLQGVNVTVTGSSSNYTITFVETGAQPLFTVDTSELARGPPILTWDNATSQIKFTFDLGASIQISKPFDLDLASVFGNGALASIANALIGAGASGSLSVNIGAQLHVVLGLDLSSPATVGGSNLSQSVQLNATGGSFTLTYQAPLTPPQSVTATAQSGGSLAANTYYYVVTAVTTSGETAASSEVSAIADSTNKKVALTWSSVAGALSYKIYRGTTPGTYTGSFTSGTASFTDDGSHAPSGSTTPPSTGTATTAETTAAIAFDSNASDSVNGSAAQTALRALNGLGTKVSASFNGGTKTYTITFDGSLGTVAALTADGSKLTGTKHSLYLVVGDGDTATHLDLTASVAGTNLNFHAMIGPFGLFVQDGNASLGGTIRLHLDDHHGDGRFNLVSFGAGALSSDIGSIGDFVSHDSVCFKAVGSSTCGTTASNIATATLPLFIGTDSFKLAINDPILEPTNGAGSNNLVLSVGFDLQALFDGGSPFSFSINDGTPNEMPWQGFNPQLPSLFALLADPSVVVDGLDQVFGAIQNLVQGQIFGVKLPLLGDLLANNPLSEKIGEFRSNLLQPLANLLRENNVGLDSLVTLIQNEIFSVVGPSGLDILEKYDGTAGTPTSSDIHFQLMKDGPDGKRSLHCAFGDHSCENVVNIFNADEIEVDVKLGKTFPISTGSPIAIDLGLPALGFDASFTPSVSLQFGMNFGFGIDAHNGFYFVTDGGNPASPDHQLLHVGALVTLSGVDCPASGTNGTLDRAHADGRLLVLALHLQDGTDVNGDGAVSVQCADGSPVIPDSADALQSMEISGVFFSGHVDIHSPDSSNPGELTLSNLLGGGFGEIFDVHIAGGADLRADAVVDFSTLGSQFAQILPSISLKILIDFSLTWDSQNGFQIDSPEVVFGDITLDLGSFISNFAGPILQKIKDVLDPLAWLIGPSGFLNMRIPLLSDLAGHTITGADLVTFFDPTDGPSIKKFLDFVLQLYHLVDLVQQATSDGGEVKLNFGDLVLAQGDPPPGAPSLPNPHNWSFFDNDLSSGGFLGAGKNLMNMGSLPDLNVPDQLPAPSMEGSQSSSSSEFTSGIQGSTAFDFPILSHPSDLINLLFGKPVTLVEITLPELSFNFSYRQEFPIIGPLVGTFEGGIGAKLDLRLGYDTQGLTDFLASKNAASLIDGFFFDTKDANGNPLPVATLTAEIAVGAAIDLALIKAGVEGGIRATVLFSWDDLNKDGKVRLDELKSNLLANGGDPLAVFDISGEFDLFLRAYVTIELYITSFTLTFEFPTITLFKFDVPFTRPAFLGNVSNGTLTLAIGPSSNNRLQGDLTDGSESIFVRGTGGGNVSVWSPQFGRDSGNAQDFNGITSIVANGGAGDDTIDLSQLIDSTITVVIHGGDGNDTLIGPQESACTNGVCAQLFGDGGDDTLTSSCDTDASHGCVNGNADLLNGGDGKDTLNGSSAGGSSTLQGGGGVDTLHGGPGAETLDPGSGNANGNFGDDHDMVDGGGGADTYIGLNTGSVWEIPTNKTDGAGTLSLAGFPSSVTFYLKHDKVLVGWGSQGTSSSIPGFPEVNDYEHMILVDHIDAVSHFVGGKGADVFNIYETNDGSATYSTPATFDGQGGNDTYDFIGFGSSAAIDAHITDNGNPWDSGDLIVIDGTSSGDNILVKGSSTTGEVCKSTSSTCTASTQHVVYDAPFNPTSTATADVNVISLLVNGNNGADHIKVASTNGDSPVKVDGGAGDDIITVGDGSLSGIVGISRPGLNNPYGVGPLAIVGGGGIDTLVLDGSTDPTVYNSTDPTQGPTHAAGTLNAWTEARQTAPAPNGAQVGAVGGLGTVLYPSALDFKGSTNADPGRIEFDGVEALTVKLGSGGDTFTVGGDGLAQQLPPTRQEKVLEFDQSPAIMTTVIGGNGADTVRVLGTADVTRDTVDGKVSALTVTPNVNGQDQHFVISDRTGNNGYFTLTYQYQETKALPFDVTQVALETAVKAAFTLVGDPSNVWVTGSPGDFHVHFAATLGNVATVVAKVVPLMIVGQDGTDRLRIQAAYMDTFFDGGPATDSASINIDAISQQEFTQTDVVAHVDVTGDGLQNDVQHLHLSNVVGGTFELVYQPTSGPPIHTQPIQWDAPAIAVRDALAAMLDEIGIGFHDPDKKIPNVGVAVVPGGYTISFINELATQPQPALTTNVLVTQTQQGSGGQDAIQHVHLEHVPTGSFSLDYTYEVQPLGLAADRNHVGSLCPIGPTCTYYYAVSAIDALNQETLPSDEIFATIGQNGAVQLSWGEVENAVSYRVYRGTAAGAENIYFTSTGASFLDDGLQASTSGAPAVTTPITAIQTTIAIDHAASGADVQSALEQLPSIGAGNVSVTGGAGEFTIEFNGKLAHRAIAPIVGNVDTLRSNGVHAVVTLDGGEGSDTYEINTIGGRTDSLINVFDTGIPSGGNDSLVVNGTENADVFLLRAATADNGLAFIALINGPTPLLAQTGDPVERINYNQNLESIEVNGGNGNDQFYIDDTRASITINGDEGSDFFQIGQLYKSRRTPLLAGVAAEDVYATIDTTQGWLSNGISKPMTINGGIGDDNFIVFHNLDTLDLNGDDGNDTFLVQAFALAGSQEDHRKLTDLSGGAGADLIQYAVDAPVHIDGGDGFDTVVVIGTEFNDDFVITSNGVFGAGLNVSFVNIESLVVDGGAGDDRFFVQGTNPTWTTEIDGGLGSDAIFINGPTPANGVIANTLLGHSGIVTHTVESLGGCPSPCTPDNGAYAGIDVVGISANVADNDTPGVVVTPTGGASQVVMGDGSTFSAADGTEDSFSVVLTRPPDMNVIVSVKVTPPEGLVLLSGDGGTPQRLTSSEAQTITLHNVVGQHVTLHLDGVTTDVNWDASASDVAAAVLYLIQHDGTLSSHGPFSASDIDVEQDGTKFTVTFVDPGQLAGVNVNQITATLHVLGGDTPAPGGSASWATGKDGGFSLAQGLTLNFTSANWWVPQSIFFGVDNLAETIPTSGDIQNSLQVSCVPVGPPPPDPPPCQAPVPHPTIDGTVKSSGSVDANANTTGDEYAVLTATTAIFDTPSSTLQEGLRGESLKITGGDAEAAGQIRMVLGSYVETITPGGTFTLGFGGASVAGVAANLSAVQTAVNTLLGGTGKATVTQSGSDFRIELLGTLYLSFTQQFTVGGVAGTIDATTIKLNSPWTAEPLGSDVVTTNPATFEISLFSNVHVPGVSVKIYSAETPAVVVIESQGSTTVAEGDANIGRPAPDQPGYNDDTIQVALSKDPGSGHSVTVSLGDNGANLIAYYVWDSVHSTFNQVTSLTFDHTNWSALRSVEVRAVDDLVVRGFHRADLAISATSYAQYLATVTIADDHAVGVRVTESNGSTNVIEYKDTDFGLALATARADGFPFQDSYIVALTEAPAAGQVIAITVGAQATRTSETGGIVSYSQQLQLCMAPTACQTTTTLSDYKQFLTLNFDLTNWNVPQTVWVRALENDRVDGMDTHVFAQQLAQLNDLQGPLLVNGGEGADRTGLLEREPVMLPGEKNLTPSMGKVVDGTEAVQDTNGNVVTPATITIDPSTLAEVSITEQAGVTDESVQEIAVNAIGGTFKLGCTTCGHTTTGDIAFNAPAVAIENALKTLLGRNLTVSVNGSVYEVKFLGGSGFPTLTVGDGTLGQTTAHVGTLVPIAPADLKDFTIEITQGTAKNKTRIITAASQSGSNWVLTLDHPWFSPFTGDASVPDNTSYFTLLLTNPNLLADETQEANLMFVYDTDNPASFDDPHLTPNPFGEGQLFYDTSLFGPFDEHGHQQALNQFRITGFGMGQNRCIGGPARPAGQVDNGVLTDANACTGPVGGNEPGGITFKGLQDVELNFGPGNTRFTIKDTPPSTLVRVNTGAGDDVVNVEKIESHTFVNAGAGNDIVNIHNTSQQLSDLLGLLTVSGDSPQATTINLTNGSPAQGTAVDPVSAEQKLTVDGTSGSFTVTYVPQPLNLTASQNPGSGTLAKDTYYYVVTAILPGGQTIASPEAFDQVSGNAAVDLAWYPVPLATGYKIYRGTDTGQENVLVGTTSNTFFTDTGSGSAGSPPTLTTTTTIHAPVTVNYGDTAQAVQTDLETLVGSGNVKVQKAGNVYLLFFQGAFKWTAIPLLLTDPANLKSGKGELDQLNIDDSGSTATQDAALLTSTSLTGLDMPIANQIQQLVLDATAGTFTLTYSFPLVPVNVKATTGTAVGALAAGTHYYVVTAVVGGIETSASSEVAALTAPNGSVDLSWDAVASATEYHVYRGATTGGEASGYLLAVANHLTDLGGALTVVDTGAPPSAPTVFVHQTTTPLAWNASASAPGSLCAGTPCGVQQALEALGGIGAGNVVVTKTDDVYVIHFQGTLSDSILMPLTAAAGALQKTTENLGGGTTTATGLPSMATITTRASGFGTPETNQVQLLTVSATGGTYTLTFKLGPTTFTTAPIPYNASAEQVRQAIQDAVAVGQTSDPNTRLYIVDKVDATVDLYPSAYTNGTLNQNVYVINFQGELRKADGGLGVNTVTVDTSHLTGSASMSTRMDGIDYYGFEQVNIKTGAGTDVFNVQGTTIGSNDFHGVSGPLPHGLTPLSGAQTNVTTNAPIGSAGSDRVYLSSDANLDWSSWSGFDFLTGNLDDFQGALNIDLGLGRHRLFLSDEASTHPDGYSFTRSLADPNNAGATTSLLAGADVYLTRAGHTGISYRTSGNLFDGVDYWTGRGNDTVYVDATKPDAAERTTTILDTGLGNDAVTVSLQPVTDGFFVLETSGGSTTGDAVDHALPSGTTDNDIVDASLSYLPLIIIGGFGNDMIRGGHANDIVLGDGGIVQYTTGPVTGETLLAQFGFGGRGDVIDTQATTPIYDPRWVYSRDLTSGQIGGGNDTIYGGDGEDILIGGTGNDAIDGGANDDLIFGDAVQLQRRDVIPGVTGDITNPRFQTLKGTQIYDTANATLGNAMNDGNAQSYRELDGDGAAVPGGTFAPDWAEYRIVNLYESYAIQAATGNPQIYGNDYIAGGPADDTIFGQLGNDAIQGDGSIDLLPAVQLPASCDNGTVGYANWNFRNLVGACRDSSDALWVNPSSSLATDGSDYIEGGGGSDTIFGNQGQDDIIGGSSNLFTLTGTCTTANEVAGSGGTCRRPDAPNLIFGGSGGSDIARLDGGATGTNSESHDADTIVANNGDIVRIVGVSHAPQAGFQKFGYDTSAFEGFAAGVTTYEHIVPRAVTLLDYTPGGPDLKGLTVPVVPGDIGAGSGASAAGASSFTNAVASWYSGPVGPGQAAGSEVHGGQGDDTVYGGAGNDVLFGDGQNDVLIGGYGNDWISGGNGDDGILGDDGRIFIDRVGINESLFGDTTGGIPAGETQNDLISTPGTMQEAVINSVGAVRYTAVLLPDNLDPTPGAVPNTTMPRPLYASDVIYGGLGNDALHGGAGDDAMSGGEALAVAYTDNYSQTGTQLNASRIESDFFHPYNPGNVLGYSPTLTYQAQYDPNDPFRKITLTTSGALDKTTTGGQDWLLNFNSAEGPADGTALVTTGNWCGGTTYTCVATDGNDALFGDLGNDWLVGGTGRDTMYGGWGNDYLNADDILNTGTPPSVTNVGTDTNPSYEDIALGGAGRDVLVANTGGDRLIDWSGEFDSYLVPFSPFGMATVSRTVQPQLPEYLDALSASDGADPYLAAHYGSDPTRNGEPFGELGIVLQHDAAWGDQKGKPRDPQAGNTPGSQRDVLRTAGNKPINSPDTDPPVAGAAVVTSAPAAPVVEMAPFVSSGDQTLAPLVITGAIGAAVAYTVKAGTKSVSGTGVIGATGKFSILIDVSTLPDGTVTATATLTLSGFTSAVGSTTALKDTVVPGSVGLALLGYVGLAGLTTTPLTLTGDAGDWVDYYLAGPSGCWLEDTGNLDSTGKLTVQINFTGCPDGVYPVTAIQMDSAGNFSPIVTSSPTMTLDTVVPVGSFTVNTAPSNTALTNNPTVSLAVSFADPGSGTNLVRVSVNGGATWSAWQAYTTALSVTLPSPDATYTVIVQVADKAGNIGQATQKVILDRTGPTLTPSLSAANNGTFYDVGAPITLTWAASDLNGVQSVSASVEGQTISASGGTIDVDILNSGDHMVTITAKDKAGNVTTKTITFTIHATAKGILNAINDGAARGWISASFKASLVTQINGVIGAPNPAPKIRGFISVVQGGTTSQITAAYKALLLNWANDLLARS